MKNQLYRTAQIVIVLLVCSIAARAQDHSSSTTPAIHIICDQTHGPRPFTATFGAVGEDGHLTAVYWKFQDSAGEEFGYGYGSVVGMKFAKRGTYLVIAELRDESGDVIATVGLSVVVERKRKVRDDHGPTD